MKLVVFTSLKGGCGKSTTLMATASALVEKGIKTACFEADDNEPLAAWRNYGKRLNTWDKNCGIYSAQDIGELEQSYDQAKADKCKIGLIDTRGGGSDHNQTILSNASLIIIPTGLSVIEVDDTLETLKYVLAFMKTVELDRPIGISINRIPTGRLSKGDEESLELLHDIPVFEAKLHERKIYKDMKGIGHLHLYHEALLNSEKRIAASHTDIALKEVRKFTNELLEGLGGIE